MSLLPEPLSNSTTTAGRPVKTASRTDGGSQQEETVVCVEGVYVPARLAQLEAYLSSYLNEKFLKILKSDPYLRGIAGDSAVDHFCLTDPAGEKIVLDGRHRVNLSEFDTLYDGLGVLEEASNELAEKMVEELRRCCQERDLLKMLQQARPKPHQIISLGDARHRPLRVTIRYIAGEENGTIEILVSAEIEELRQARLEDWDL